MFLSPGRIVLPHHPPTLSIVFTRRLLWGLEHMTDLDVTNRRRGFSGRKGASGNQPMAESGQAHGQRVSVGETV